MRLNGCSVSEAMAKLENGINFSFHLSEPIESVHSTLQIQSVLTLQNHHLINYLQSKRSINIDIAREYGYNADQQDHSFWKGIYSNLQNNEDVETKKLLIKTQDILDDLSKDQSINNPTLRECFIHYRKGNIDNVLKLYTETIKAFPIAEMAKSVKLLTVLPDIIKLNTASLAVVNRTLEQGIEEKYIESRNKLPLILDMIPDAEQRHKFKNDVIDKFEDMLVMFVK